MDQREVPPDLADWGSERRGSDDGAERLLWSAHPSWRSLLPVTVIGAGLTLAGFLHAVEIAQAIIDLTARIIPWTQAGVDRFFLGLRAAILLPAALPLLRILLLFLTRYELTDQRLRIHHGLFPRRHDEIALHRIRDRIVKRSLFGMILGYGTVRLLTRDPSFPVARLQHVTRPYDRSEAIRSHALRWKDRMGYREFDTGPLS